MIGRIARTYVILLFAVELILIASSLLMNLNVWIGVRDLSELYGPVLFMVALLTAFPVAFLAKERNIWRNEFMSCPVWVRGVAIVFCIYGLAAIFCQTVFFPGTEALKDVLIVAAFPLAIEAVPLLILCAVLREDWRRPEIVKRSLLSFAVAVVCAAVFIWKHATYLPNTLR